MEDKLHMKNVRTVPRTYHYEKTTILLDNHVYKRLREKGKFGETFSQVIERLLNEVDEKNKL